MGLFEVRNPGYGGETDNDPVTVEM